MWLLGFELQTFGRAVGCSYPLSHLTSPILHYKYTVPFPVLSSPHTSVLPTHTFPVSLASLSSPPQPPWTPKSSLLPAQQGPSPCEHGGSCINTPGSFNCLCLPGYTGSRCEADHNECLSQPCHPGSTCLDLLATFHCLCPPGRAGWDCGWVRQRTNFEPKGNCLARVTGIRLSSKHLSLPTPS
jgi:hypothetical protein